MKRLECICDAVASYHNYWEPESPAYALRNPGMLHGESKNQRTPEGKRVFSCHRAGYQALMDVVQKKCTAHPEETLQFLFESLGIVMKLQQERALDFLTRCMNSNVPTLRTNLKFFIEE